MIDSLYPPSPKVNAEEITRISAAYRKQVVKVMLSILFFIVCYVAVLVASVLFFLLCLFVVLAALKYVRHWIVLLLVGGVLVMGGMLLYFLVKFLFQKKPEETNDRIEIKEEAEPLLFEFIHKLCDEVGTDRPKKVVISPAVNAAVYYDLSFVSLLFPARKNLEIGAGLLNSINLGEFKAVLAHEFGHFSQSSTKLGSYVYRVRLVLFNLIYQNDGWFETLQSASSVHAVISVFGQITVWLAKGILTLFTSIFKRIDLNYMALSREMEFHADAVAVSVSGSQSIIDALHRIDVAEEVFNNTITNIHQFAPGKTVVPENFFALHRFYLKQYARDYQLELEGDLPLIVEDPAVTTEIKGRLQFENVFSTHPPVAARKVNAESFNIPSAKSNGSPWQLFSRPIQLQEELTKLIEPLQVSGAEVIQVTNEEIIKKAEDDAKENQLHPDLREYFKLTSNIADLPQTKDQPEGEIKDLSIENLFGKKITNRIKRFFLTMEEEQTMLAISSGNMPVKQFVFDGTPQTRYYSRNIYEQIKADNEAEVEELKKHNQKISNWFYFKTLEKNASAAHYYLTVMNFYKVLELDISNGAAIRTELEEFYAKHIQVYRDIEDVPYQLKKLTELYEKWNEWRINVPSREVPALFSSIFSEGYRHYFMSIELENPANFEQLGGLGQLHKAMVDQLDILYSKQNELARVLVRKQNEMFCSLTTSDNAA